MERTYSLCISKKIESKLPTFKSHVLAERMLAQLNVEIWIHPYRDGPSNQEFRAWRDIQAFICKDRWVLTELNKSDDLVTSPQHNFLHWIDFQQKLPIKPVFSRLIHFLFHGSEHGFVQDSPKEEASKSKFAGHAFVFSRKSPSFVDVSIK